MNPNRIPSVVPGAASWRRRLACAAIALAPFAVQAQSAAAPQATPAGLWRSVDDASGKDRSLVRISEHDGVFSGRIEKLLGETTGPNPVCEACTDERKGQPITGMTIIRGVRHSAGDPALWDGGEILDPANGKTYKVRLTPKDGGRSLAVRGYVGAPLLGRTQTWIRVE